MHELFPDEVEAYRAEYGMPEFPDYYEGPGARALILFREHDTRVTLTYVTLEDAQEYCSREDTHGSGWFIGFQQVNDDEEYEPDSEYDGDGQVLIAGVLYDEATGEEAEADEEPDSEPRLGSHGQPLPKPNQY